MAAIAHAKNKAVPIRILINNAGVSNSQRLIIAALYTWRNKIAEDKTQDIYGQSVVYSLSTQTISRR